MLAMNLPFVKVFGVNLNFVFGLPIPVSGRSKREQFRSDLQQACPFAK